MPVCATLAFRAWLLIYKVPRTSHLILEVLFVGPMHHCIELVRPSHLARGAISIHLGVSLWRFAILALIKLHHTYDFPNYRFYRDVYRTTTFARRRRWLSSCTMVASPADHLTPLCPNLSGASFNTVGRTSRRTDQMRKLSVHRFSNCGGQVWSSADTQTPSCIIGLHFKLRGGKDLYS